MKKIVDGKTVDLSKEEILSLQEDSARAKEIKDKQIEDVRIAEIWEQIREQEALSVRALLNNDTVWIEKRKQNILDLKASL